jgi:hypothetical protein
MPVPAGIIGNGFKTTLCTFFDMPAKSSCAACLNMAYHLLLLIGEMIVLPIRYAIAMQDIGNFKAIFV